MQLVQFIGDSKTHRVPLTWDGEDFMPGNAWSLIFTAKHSAHDQDITAVFQKVSGAGIEVTGNLAEVEVVPSGHAARLGHSGTGPHHGRSKDLGIGRLEARS